jgi:hypothetical protein
MNVRIEVKSAVVDQKTIRGKDGKEFVIREQCGYVDLGKPYPQEIRIPVEQGKEAYPPGDYVMDPHCFYVDRFGKLSLGRLRLVRQG